MPKRTPSLYGTGAVVPLKNGVAIRWYETVMEDGIEQRKMQYQNLGNVTESEARSVLAEKYQSAAPSCGPFRHARPIGIPTQPDTPGVFSEADRLLLRSLPTLLAEVKALRDQLNAAAVNPRSAPTPNAPVSPHPPEQGQSKSPNPHHWKTGKKFWGKNEAEQLHLDAKNAGRDLRVFCEELTRHNCRLSPGARLDSKGMENRDWNDVWHKAVNGDRKLYDLVKKLKSAALKRKL